MSAVHSLIGDLSQTSIDAGVGKTILTCYRMLYALYHIQNKLRRDLRQTHSEIYELHTELTHTIMNERELHT